MRNIKSILAVFTFSFPPFLLAGAGLVSLSLSVATISSRIVFVDWKTEVIIWGELFLKIRKRTGPPAPLPYFIRTINKLQGMWHQLNNIENPLVAMRNFIERRKISIQLFVKIWNNILDIFNANHSPDESLIWNNTSAICWPKDVRTCYWWKWQVIQWQAEGITRVAIRNWRWRQEGKNIEQLNDWWCLKIIKWGDVLIPFILCCKIVHSGALRKLSRKITSQEGVLLNLLSSSTLAEIPLGWTTFCRGIYTGEIVSWGVNIKGKQDVN